MITKKVGRYNKKQKRQKRILKVLEWLGYSLVLAIWAVGFGLSLLFLFVK